MFPFSNLRRVLRGRSRLALLALSIVLFGGACAGAYVYALRQWSKAQSEVTADGPLDAARRRLTVCLWIWPQSSAVHLLAARAARLSGDMEGAEAHLNKCLKLQKGASEAVQLEFLLMRVQMGEEDEVAPALLELVDRKHAETPLILETLARAYMHRLRYKPAYACLSAWIEYAPEAVKPYHWRGWVQERLNNPKRALEDYQRALERDPQLFTVRLRVGEMYLEDKLPLEALTYLEPLLKEYPDRADVLARLGQCRFVQGQTEEARRLMEAALEQMPNDLQLLLHLGKLDLLEGQPEAAERRLRRVLELDPTDTEAQYALVSCLQLQGRREEAAAALQLYEKHKAMLERANQLLKDEAERPTNDPRVASEIGTLLLSLRQERLGLYWLEQALQRDPGNQPAHRALADYYEGKGDTKKAEAHRRMVRK